jgi:methylenetetrahydrofolate dehydrogenase (NADP+)/methenyltetrahydrofolate cyclohydrolase
MAVDTEPPRILDGAAVAREIEAEVAGATRELARRGVVPGLDVLLVGDDAASHVYVRNKQRAADKAGMRSRVERLPASATTGEVLDALARLNADATVHGILVQLPLPHAVDTQRVMEAVDPRKDVDGFHPENFGRLLAGLPGGFLPCTPAGILTLLKRYEIPLAGRHAVVLGRSNIVGKPLAVLLLREDCTVTVCHSRTADLPAVSARADILVAAVGRMALVTADWVRQGAVVVDVGVHRVTDEATCRRLFGDDAARLRAVREKGGTLVGDVHPLEVRTRAGWISPVPGGVGPLTIAELLRNTVRAAERAT